MNGKVINGKVNLTTDDIQETEVYNAFFAPIFTRNN